MAHFTYTAQKADGEIYRSAADARDRFEFYEVVRREGGKLMSMTEEAEHPMLTMRYWNTMLAHVSEYDKILFARNLGAMLSAGLSLSRALALIGRQSKNLKLQEVVTQIEGAVRHGETFHDAVAKQTKIFPPLFIAMVRAGEEGGDLAASLGLVADQMERIYDLKKKIRGALMYPSIIVFAIIGVGYMMMTQVVPTLAQTFGEMKVELPNSTKAVIAVSDFLTQNAKLSAVLFVVIAAAIVSALRTEQGRIARDWLFIKMPLIGTLTREANAARTARTLASLLTAGVDVLTALEITREVVQNRFFRTVIGDAQKAVGAGEPLSSAFSKREDLYPPFVGEMMSVGEETGATPEMLKRLAAYYENEVDGKTRDMSTIIEPFLMVFIGVTVGFFAVSMITPIYSLTASS